MDIDDQAPDFTAPTQDGGTITLSEFRGQPVVLYFYPKADTPGCTQEAKDFTELGHDFKKLGAKVIGVSKDAPAKLEKFGLKYDLGVTLVSDAEGDICERYGVWGEKKMYGKTFMGITRATFLIDGQGNIARIWPKVSVKGHAEEVLAAVHEMQQIE